MLYALPRRQVTHRVRDALFQWWQILPIAWKSYVRWALGIPWEHVGFVQDGCMLSGSAWKQFLYKSSIDTSGTLHLSPVCEQTFQQNCSKSMKFKRLSFSRVFNKQNPRNNVALMYSGVIWFFPIWRQCFCLEEWESVKLPAQESLEPKWLRYFF